MHKRQFHIAAELEILQRPVGVDDSYVVTCRCGWKSQRTGDWRKSMDSHFYREDKLERESK